MSHIRRLPHTITTRGPLINNHFHVFLPRLVTYNTSQFQYQTNIISSSATTRVDENHLLRVCTILYQQQFAPFSKLQTQLQKVSFQLSHEFFLQVCNKFHLSWRPVYLFYQFTLTHPESMAHTVISLNKMADVIGKSRNIDLFWKVLSEMAQSRLVNVKTYRIAMRHLGKARELNKCVEFFRMVDSHGCPCGLDCLNLAVQGMCEDELVDEARHVVFKLKKDWLKPDAVTYKHLITGFCNSGDVMEASKLWNLMVDEGFEPDMDSVDKMMSTLFKRNQFSEGLKLFQAIRAKRMEELGLSTYNIMIDWMCRRGKLTLAHTVFDEMRMRSIQADDSTLASLIYGLVSKRRIQQAYSIVNQIDNPNISIYHALIKGFLRIKRAGDATEVFREMIRRGCEPIMHTYIMLLQGHLGRRGRTGADPLVNFDTIFVGGLVKAEKFLEATKYVERSMRRGVEVPRFDYNKFLHCFSSEQGVVMFEEMGIKLREVGLFDLADVLSRYGEKMATRDRRRDRGNTQRCSDEDIGK